MDHHAGDPDPADEKGGGGLGVLGTTKAAWSRRVGTSALNRARPAVFWREVVIVDPGLT
jgi:hypothetical protein